MIIKVTFLYISATFTKTFLNFIVFNPSGRVRFGIPSIHVSL